MALSKIKYPKMRNQKEERIQPSSRKELNFESWEKETSNTIS